MIKIIAIDMDGTLLNNEGKVTERNAAAIRKYQEMGGIVVINTGRAFPMAAKIIRAAGLSCDYICLNGAAVYNAEGTCLSSDAMPYEDIRLLRHLEQKYRVFVDYLTSEGAQTSGTRAFTEEHYIYQAFTMAEEAGKSTTKEAALARFQSILNSIQYECDIESLIKQGVSFFKVVIVAMDPHILSEIKTLLKNMPQFAVSSSFKTNIEVTASHVDKGRTLIDYAAAKEISMDEIMVIGDSENDLAMLNKPFGKTVAMGNAENDIKDICSEVTLSNEEDGVAWAIEKWGR